MNTEASTKFIEMLKEIDDCQPRSYSGRGMYGSQCVGVTTDEPFKVIAELAFAAGACSLECDDNERIMADILQALGETRSDSMGRSTIVYWPRVQWVETDGEDDFVCYRKDVNPHGETCVQMSPNDDYNWCDGCVQRMDSQD